MSSAPIATFVLPILLVTLPLFVFCADICSKHLAQRYMQQGLPLEIYPPRAQRWIRSSLNLPEGAMRIDLDKLDFDAPNNFMSQLWSQEQIQSLALMSYTKQEKAKWFANSDRNVLGYLGVPLLAITGLIATLTLPANCGLLLSTIIPVFTASMVIAGLAIAFSYALANQEKQIDNKYKLALPNEQIEFAHINQLYFTPEQEEEASAENIVGSIGANSEPLTMPSP